MPALQTPPPPPPVHPASLRRLYLSAHLRFIDEKLSPATLCSHYRALLLDSSTDQPSLEPLIKQWQLLESVLIRSPKSALASCLPPTQGGFWDLVIGHTLRGDISAAHTLVSSRLREAPDWPSRVASLRLRDGRVDPLAALEHVLESGDDVSWRRAVKAWADSEELEGEYEIRKVMLVLLGDREAVKEASRNWVEMFVGLVLHGNEMREAVNDAFVMVDSDGVLGEHEWRIVKLGIENEFEAMLELVYRVHGAFFAAHFGDILFRKGLVESDLRAHYIRHYSRMLQEMCGNWRISIDYLLRIEAKQAISTVLETVPITGAGDPTAEKLYMVASRTGDVRSICTRIAELCRNDGNFGGCMTWLIRGGLRDDVRIIADESLKEALRVGAGSCQATHLAYVVTALRQSELSESHLLHVCAYHDFQEWIMKLRDLNKIDDSGKNDERENVVQGLCTTAMDLLIALPRSFWCVIVYDTVQTIRPSDASYISRNVITSLLSGLDTPHTTLQKRLLQENRGVSVETALRNCRTSLTNLFSIVV